MKAATVKNLTRKQKFIEIGIPPMPVVTRWGTWLGAVKYYSNNLQAVKTIIRNFHGNGILVQKCLDAINNSELENDLISVDRCYFGILALIDDFKGRFLTIKEGMSGISELNLKEDPIRIKEYIGKRLSKNSATTIINNHSILGLDPNIINLFMILPEVVFLLKEVSVNLEKCFTKEDSLIKTK